jgi:Ca2+-binding RTX toxin-like protein
MTVEVDTLEFPASSVVFIQVRFGSSLQWFNASGVIVGKNDILTAAHVVYSPDHGPLAEIRIFANYDPDRGGTPIDTAGLTFQYFLEYEPYAGDSLIQGDERFGSRAGSETDIALINLDQNVLQYGMMWIDPIQYSGAAYVTGFPGFYGFNPMQDIGFVSDGGVDNYINISALDIHGGNSGGPVWAYDGIFPSVMGVVSTALAAADVDDYWRTLQTMMNDNDFMIGDQGLTWSGQTTDENITGMSGIDIINGDQGADKIYGWEGNDILRGGRGSFADTLDGMQDDDLLYGEDGNDILEGGDGNDTIYGGNGADVINGNSRVPQFAYPDGLPPDDDILFGGAGNDTIEGNRGDDTLDGGEGVDRLVGGSGNDTYWTDSDIVIELAGGGDNDIMYASAATSTIAKNVERLELVGGAIIALGNEDANALGGNWLGNVLDGKGGDDVMSGGNGDDTYIVDSSGDVVFEGPFIAGGWDAVQSSVSFTLDDYVEELSLTGSAAINGTGNDSDNRLTGNSAANILQGLDGADVIDGGKGVDSLEGGDGDDLYLVNDTGDSIVELVGEGHDTVQSSVACILNENIEDLVLIGKAAIAATGNDLGNLIVGNDGANIISGLDNDDTLDGGRGKDTLTGGEGADYFRFGTLNGADTVLDFDWTEDKLDLRLLGNFESVEDLTIAQKGLDTLITFSAGNSVLLKSVDANDITDDQIKFARGDTSYYQALDSDFSIGDYWVGAFADQLAPQVEARPGQFAVYYAVQDSAKEWSLAQEIFSYNETSALSLDTRSLHQNYLISQYDFSPDFDVESVAGDVEDIVYYSWQSHGSQPESLLTNHGLLVREATVPDVPYDYVLIGHDFQGQGPAVAPIGAGKDVVTWTTPTIFFFGPGDPVPVGDGDDYAVVMQVVNANGTASAPVVVNTTTAGAQQDSEVASNADGSFVIVWESGGSSVCARRFDANGNAQGGEFVVDSNSGFIDAPNVEYLSDGKFIVYWASYNALLGEDYGVLGRLYNADGSAAGDTFVLSDDDADFQGSPDVAALDDGQFAVVWDSSAGAAPAPGTDIKIQTFDSGGQRIGDSYYVNAATAGDQLTPSIAYLGDDRVVVTWQTGDAALSDSSLWGQILTLGENSGSGNGGIATAAGVQKLYAGSKSKDSITANDLDNVLEGGAGDDTLVGGTGADLLNGGLGMDTASYRTDEVGITINLETKEVSGGEAEGDTLVSIEHLIGGSGDDVLTGDAGVNKLDGGLGDDTIAGLAGADILIGNVGNDTVTYAASDAAVTVNLATAKQKGGAAEGDALSGFEQVVGSNFDDTLSGSKDVNSLSGGLGDDLLVGGTGADLIDGGDGVDTASYAGSKAGVSIDLSNGAAQDGLGDGLGDILVQIENLVGSRGKDTLTGDAGANSIDGDAGDDILSGADGADNLLGGLGADILSGGIGNDTVIGGGGADTLDGGADEDTLSYALSKAAVTVTLSENAGPYTIGKGGDATGDKIENFENVVGGNGKDSLTGNSLANVIDGGAGNDLLAGLAGADVLIGGDGNDTATYEQSALGVTVDLAGNTSSGGDAEDDALIGIENLTGSSSADTLVGSDIVNVIFGGLGDDTISGGNGNDIVDGGGGSSTNDGGSDTIDFSYLTADQNITVALGALKAKTGAVAVTKTSGLGGDVDQIANFENIIGGFGDDTLTGNAGNNVINGGDGNDVIAGGLGADDLDGSAGSGDTLNYGTDKKGITIDLSANSVSGAPGSDADGDVIANFENVTGGNGIDFLTGTDGVNLLNGNAGNDILNGGDGDDLLIGGKGADQLEGLTGNDTASYATSSAGVTVDLNLATAQKKGGDAAGDILSSIENLIGSRAADTLTGDAAANVITGGLKGDILTGGGGDDVFQFNAATEGKDTIKDFASGEDRIGIFKAGFAGLNAIDDADFEAHYLVSGDTSATAKANETGHGQFLFNTTTGILSWDDDGMGAHAAATVATMIGVHAITVADFLLS